MDLLTYINDLDFQLSPLPYMDDCSFLNNYMNADQSIAVPETEKRKVEDMSFTLTPQQGGITTGDCSGSSKKRGRFASEKGVQTQTPPIQPNRRVWVKNRSQAWWDTVNHPDFPDSDFRKAFRMSRGTFDFICNELSSAIAKEDTTLRQAIPVEKRVAVCIWRLATGEPLRVVSSKFGLGISTCHKLILEVCSAIKTFLLPKFLRWPDAFETEKFMSRFESSTGIPNVVGSMYTIHIPIVAPKNNVAQYFNQNHTDRTNKASYSVTIQGVVDPDGVFTDICIGSPGGFSDEQVLTEKSNLRHFFESSQQQPPPHHQWIVGGSEYPLMDWMMVPYSHENLTWAQYAFNNKTSDLQRVAVEAFRRLKARWCCLQKRNEVKLQDLPNVLGACCVLHNICERLDEKIEPDLIIKPIHDEDKTTAGASVRSIPAMDVRDSLAHHLLHGGRVS
ncbi:hypothetical protein ZOSMA_205G00410 [Zostera marina]|uniref:DDE Tnp4 domain-containing protein n=1 Tax=Zostera marina TaxID=29655 RepID=A0A0K9PLL7_ZOSMR|nr:hypothetical protein ZOSMA_205G00410 [Zostera marina]